MTNLDIAQRRLLNQRLAGEPFDRPEDLVRWLGAVQSQDYPGAKWAMAQRLRGITDADLDRSFNKGAILRTHVMRPTWHFVLPDDIRWMLELTGPRISAGLKSRHRQLELDGATFARSNDVVAKALQGGKQVLRQELRDILLHGGIDVAGIERLNHVILMAELDMVICSGELRGKQQTYALFDERAPRTKSLLRDEALALLTRRYFTSHGPATVKDYVWWSGLTAAIAREGIEMLKPGLVSEDIDGQTYWLASDAPRAGRSSAAAYLLPNYDEYSVAYANRTALFDEEHADLVKLREGFALGNIVVFGGQIKGDWKRIHGKTIIIEVRVYTHLDASERGALAAAAERYGAFLGLPVELQVTTPAGP